MNKPAIDDPQWVDIEDQVGYSVHPHGYVKSCRKGSEKFIMGAISRLGYHRVAFYHGEDIFTTTIHRMVARAFVPNPDGKDQVNHIDGNKLNNHFSNLEWVNGSENSIHKFRVLGFETPSLKLSDDDADDIVAVHSYGARMKDICTAYGIARSTAWRVIKYRTQRHRRSA